MNHPKKDVPQFSTIYDKVFINNMIISAETPRKIFIQDILCFEMKKGCLNITIVFLNVVIFINRRSIEKTLEFFTLDILSQTTQTFGIYLRFT